MGTRAEKKTHRTLLGIVVDKQLLRRVFGANMVVFYIMLKDTADRILAKLQTVGVWQQCPAALLKR